MRKKSEEPKPRRHRRTQLELWQFPSGARKAIAETANLADLPPARVFQDVVEAGLSVIRNPATSPYQSMIEFRRGLAQYQKSLNESVESTSVDRVGKGTGQGKSIIGSGDGAVAASPDVPALGPRIEAVEVQGTPQRSGDVSQRPGFEPETEESDRIVLDLSTISD